jgi:hypothetical protein
MINAHKIGEIVFYKQRSHKVVNVLKHMDSYGNINTDYVVNDGWKDILVSEDDIVSEFTHNYLIANSGIPYGLIADTTFGSNNFIDSEPCVPKCICGAHKVKDSGHSSWCDIK